MKGTGWSLVKFHEVANYLHRRGRVTVVDRGGRGEVINRRSSLMARSDLKDVDGAHDERQRRSMESSEKIGHALSSTSVFSPLLLREETREPRIPEANVGGKVHLGQPRRSGMRRIFLRRQEREHSITFVRSDGIYLFSWRDDISDSFCGYGNNEIDDPCDNNFFVINNLVFCY